MSSSSNVWNLCSNCCFLFEKLQDFLLARRLLWEPPDMFIGCCFDARGLFFRNHFRYIFLKNDDKWTPKWLQKLTQSYQKWHLKIHLSFLMEIHRKATENQKNDVNISSKSMKNWPWSSTKNDAKKHTPKKRKMFKKWSPIGVQKVTLFSGFRLVGHLWRPISFFGASWVHLGASWGHLGAILGPLGAILGPLGAS